MNRFAASIALCVATPLSFTSAPAAALEDSDRGDPQLLFSALAALQDEAFSLDFATQKEGSLKLLLQLSAEARDAQERFASDPEQVRIFSEREGVALYYASEYHEFGDDNDSEARQRELDWLIRSVDAIERSLVADPDPIFPFYEYRIATRELFSQAAWLGDPRLADFAAAAVRANRLSIAQYDPADPSVPPKTIQFEKNMLAQALYRHGYLTGNAAELAEANALAAELGDEDADLYTQSMRDLVAEDMAPYPPPGEH